MPPEVLSLRALNRALLSRQLLLDRPDLPDDADGRMAAVISAIEHLVLPQICLRTSLGGLCWRRRFISSYTLCCPMTCAVPP
jgi:hypothetical protein